MRFCPGELLSMLLLAHLQIIKFLGQESGSKGVKLSAAAGIIRNSEYLNSHALGRLLQGDIPLFHVLPYRRPADTQPAGNLGFVPKAGFQQVHQFIL